MGIKASEIKTFINLLKTYARWKICNFFR